jgi:hypothetical protein
MSDVLHDSTARFLDDWNLRFADGPTARLLRWWTLERRKQQREARKHFLEMVDTEIDECLKERDERGLSSCLDNLYGEREDSMGYTPPKYLDQIDERIQKIQQGLK